MEGYFYESRCIITIPWNESKYRQKSVIELCRPPKKGFGRDWLHIMSDHVETEAPRIRPGSDLRDDKPQA